MFDTSNEGFTIYTWFGDRLVHISSSFEGKAVYRDGTNRLLRINAKPTGFFHLTIDRAGHVEVRWAKIKTEENADTFAQAVYRALEIAEIHATGDYYHRSHIEQEDQQ